MHQNCQWNSSDTAWLIRNWPTSNISQLDVDNDVGNNLDTDNDVDDDFDTITGLFDVDNDAQLIQ